MDPAQLADLDVTVIVPMHNRAATIGRALESIARQTRRPARVLVVDDASRDGSVAAARQVPLANLEILELKQNRGPGGARNAGVAAAKTRWVAFLDSDDSWAPTFLEEVVGAAEALNADFASSGGIRELIRRPPVQRVIDAPPEGADRTTDFWRIARRFTPIVPSSAVISRSLYLRAGGFDEDVHWGEDVTLFARLWLEGRFVFVNRPLYTSAQLPGGMSAVNRGYCETALHLARLGGTLVRAAARRKPGTRLFAREFARRVYRKHRHWLGGHIRKRILHS